MSLRRRILCGYVGGLAVLLLLSGWAWFHLHRLGNASEAILQENYRSILAADIMIDSIERQDTATLLILLGQRDKGEKLLRRYQGEFEEWLRKAGDNITLPGERELVDRLRGQYQRYIETLDQVHNKETAEQIYAIIEPKFQSVRTSCGDLRKLNQDAMEQASLRAQSIAHSASRSVLGTSVFAGVTGFFCCLALANHVTRPLLVMGEITGRIAGGNFDIKVPTQGKDELALLARQIESLAESLGHFHRMNIDRLIAEKERTEAILNSIPDAVILVDQLWNVETMNPAARRVFNFATDDPLNKPFLQLCPQSALHDLLQQGSGSLAPQEPIVVGLSGRHYQATVCRVRSDIVLLLADVTHLYELDRLKTEFVMTASHELRTPITGLAMTIGLLEEQALEPQARSLVDLASEEVSRLRRLVNELLDLSGLQSGRSAMTLEAVDLSKLIRSVVEDLASEATRLNIKLDSRTDIEPTTVTGNAAKLSLVLVNLVNNALRYTDPGGEVTITASHSNGKIQIEVADTGIGIEPELLMKGIFDRFTQGGAKERAGGAGLGLAIAREIVLAHGSDIAVKSEPGNGSRFAFYLDPWKEKTDEETPHPSH